MKINALFFLSAAILFLVFSCKEDEPEPVPDPVCATYDADIKAILDKSCAYSGCHSGADAGMFVTDDSKDYTNYAGLLATIGSGTFRARTLDSLDMPPFYTPDGNPKELTADELTTITCWLDEGHPEN